MSTAMITVTCDACERPFQVADDKAGGKSPCPRCGDIKLIPSAQGASNDTGGQPVSSASRGASGGGGGSGTGGSAKASDDRAVALGLPPRDGPEVDVMGVHGSAFRSRPFAYSINVLALLAAAVGTVILVLTPATLPFAVATVLVMLACGFIWARWAILARSERLTITNKRVVMTRGLLSKSTIEMLHRTMQDIEIDQTFAQRMLGIGTIKISNAGQEDDEIVIHAVPNPERVRQVIDAYRVL